jgi:DNA-binding NtrC family response regulator
MHVLPVRPYLFLVLECDRPTAGGVRYTLDTVDEVVIGRGAERTAERSEDAPGQLTVRVPGPTMSSVHARIRRVGADWVLQDLDSTNGSYVNGRRVASATLADGDVVEIGHTIFTMRMALATPPGTASVLDSNETRPRARGLATLVPALENRYAEIADVARSRVSIALSGRSGTGKEVLAQAIHQISARPGPFVAVNCGALPANLVESQLFGHVKGAFSGAVRDEVGFVRASHGGTLFLDEVGELPKAAQVALLRVLQEAEVIPVGVARPVNVDLRIVSATADPLGKLVARGTFREDLKARIEGYAFHLPDLAARREDLGLVIASLIERMDGVIPSFAGSAGRRLFEYGWPLNVRELDQALMRAVAVAGSGPVEREHLPEAIGGAVDDGTGAKVRTRSSGPPGPNAGADDALRRELEAQLKRCRGNVSAVATAMGKDRRQLHRWFQRFGIDPDGYRQ